MLTLIFLVLMITIFGKIIGLACKATWGLTKILFTVVLLPVFLVVLVIAGFMYIALPVLVIVGAVMMITKGGK